MFVIGAGLITTNGSRFAVRQLISVRLRCLLRFCLVGKEYNGSKRWLSLGPFSFQPSEFAKVAVILFLAWMIEQDMTEKDRKSFGHMILIVASGASHCRSGGGK